jgi:hypothetical protein
VLCVCVFVWMDETRIDIDDRYSQPQRHSIRLTNGLDLQLCTGAGAGADCLVVRVQTNLPSYRTILDPRVSRRCEVKKRKREFVCEA